MREADIAFYGVLKPTPVMKPGTHPRTSKVIFASRSQSTLTTQLIKRCVIFTYSLIAIYAVQLLFYGLWLCNSIIAQPICNDIPKTITSVLINNHRHITATSEQYLLNYILWLLFIYTFKTWFTTPLLKHCSNIGFDWFSQGCTALLY